MAYHIKLEQFEGPLDLLLALIEAEKLDISRLSLAKVADQFLEYIESDREISLSSLADFLSIASRLILIKSKSLLPVLKVSEEDEKDIHDLEYQLAQYKLFKEASVKLGAMVRLKNFSFSREGFQGIEKVFCPPSNIDPGALRGSFSFILDEIPVYEKLEEEVMREVIALEDKISHFQSVLRDKIESSFGEMVADAKDKVEIVVSFLAMLEMVKQRLLYVEQNGLFEEIKIKKN